MSTDTPNAIETISLPFGQITSLEDTKDPQRFAVAPPAREHMTDDGFDLESAEFEFSDPRP